MPREVNSTQSYADKLVKLVPTEIVGAYMVLSGMIGVSPASSSKPSDMSSVLIIVVSIILLALTPIYLMRISHVKNVIQIVVTTLSFVVWVYTLGGPFLVIGIYYPIIASVILILWQMILPLVVPPQEG